MILITDCQLFAPIDFFKKVTEYKYVEIETCDWFKKSTFRNRYIIAGANGLVNLTVPIAGGREQKRLFKDVKIDNADNWRIKHWRSIVSSYRKSPFFDYYEEEVRALIFNGEEKLLIFNITILNKFCNLLNISSSVSFTSVYEQLAENKFDFRDTLLPATFQANGENWQPKYSQVFEERRGFQPNLSILDLLFCEGPNALNLMEKSVG